MHRSTNLAMILRNLHQAAAVFFRTSGFRWEVHTSDGKIGMWRKRMTNRPAGERKTFLVVPGFGDTPLSWFPVITVLHPVLSRNYDEIVVLDFPGFSGFLHNEPGFNSMDRFLATGESTIDYLKPHTVVGHSLGGWLSAHYACNMGLKNPGLEKVVLVCPSGAFESREAGYKWREQFTKAIETRDFQYWRPFLFAREPIWFPLLADEFARFLTADENIQFMLSIEERHLVEENLPKVEADVWIIWGQEDRMIPASSIEGWVRHLPKHEKRKDRVILFKGIGHSPQIESLARTAVALGRIIRTPAHRHTGSVPSLGKTSNKKK